MDNSPRRSAWLRGFWLIFVAYGVLATYLTVTAPERLPMHWSLGNSPNRWGSRNEFVFFAAFGALLALILGPGAAAIMRRLDADMYNAKEYWKRPENFPRMRDLTSTMMLALGAGMLVGFSAVLTQIYLYARGAIPGWSVWVAVAIMLVAVLTPVIWHARALRVPKDAA